MKYTTIQFLQKVQETRMIPVFSHTEKETAFSVLSACYRGGARVFEFTNRHDGALNVFKYLIERKDEFPGLALGAGTIMNVSQCEAYCEAGAAFVVAPIVDAQVAEYCKTQDISWTPGCGTLTELITSKRLGAGLIKVFPADVLGPEFIKAVLGPCPELHLMPTGGVTPEEDNLERWFNAGVTCVGMGSQLISKEILKDGDYHSLERVVKRTLEIISNTVNR